MLVCIVGFRSPVLDYLIRKQIPFAIWSKDKIPSKYSSKALGVFQEDHEINKNLVLKAKQYFQSLGDFTHIITPIESSVYFGALLAKELAISHLEPSLALLCTDKVDMKRFLRGSGIILTDFEEITNYTNFEELGKKFGYPLVLKQRRSSGSRGLFVCNNLEDLTGRIKPNYMIEKFVEGEEYSVETFIKDGKICFTNITQYVKKRHTNLLPAFIDFNLESRFLELNENVVRFLNIPFGMTHLELYLTPENKIVFGEIALRPPGGYIMNLLTNSYGFNSWNAYMAMGLGLDFKFNSIAHSYSAVNIFHPGEGRVRNIEGLEVFEDPSVHQVKLKVKKGDLIDKRMGLGQEVGHVIFASDKHSDITHLLNRIEKEFKIEIS